MALFLHNGERQLVHFQNEDSSIISYPAFPGGMVRRFQNEKVDLLIKEIISEFFSVRYKIFRFLERQKIESVSDALGIHSTVMLQNDLDLSINSVEELHQREGTISLFTGQINSCAAVLEAGVEYRALNLYAGKELAEQLAHFFPGVQFNKEQIRNVLPFPCFVSPALHKIIDAILDCPYDEATSHFYFDVKVREYFYLLLKECTATRETNYRFTPYEIEHLVLARDILLSDLTKPPLTIKKLARQAGINEFKLKVGFPQFFKTGVFECFQRARMFKAKQLLLTTNKPLKEICTMAGYPRMTNFITAFKNYFGYTPGSLRRKK
jgi:AraC-like DNA-binding protein